MAGDRDDVLLSKLQGTIESWSDEVTQAHRELTSQIGDTRSQLNALMDVIASRKARTAESDAIEVYRAQAPEFEGLWFDGASAAEGAAGASADGAGAGAAAGDVVAGGAVAVVAGSAAF